jgi:hypothetical protein
MQLDIRDVAIAGAKGNISLTGNIRLVPVIAKVANKGALWVSP